MWVIIYNCCLQLCVCLHISVTVVVTVVVQVQLCVCVCERLSAMICSHLGQNVTVAMARSQVQGCVVTAVHDIDASPSHDEHIHDT